MRTFIYTYGSLLIAAALALFLKHIPFQPYLFLCGGALAGLGLHLFHNQITFLQHSRLTYGELVDWKEVPKPTGSRGVDYYAVVNFEDNNGARHQVLSATGIWPKPSTPMGKKYPVRYNFENPDDARLDTLFDYWGPPVIILLFGVSIIVISFYAIHHR